LLGPESKLVVSPVVGRRTAETALEAFLDFYERADGCLPELVTTDEYAPSLSVIASAYGVLKGDLEMTEAEQGACDWEAWPDRYFPAGIA